MHYQSFFNICHSINLREALRKLNIHHPNSLSHTHARAHAHNEMKQKQPPHTIRRAESIRIFHLGIHGNLFIARPLSKRYQFGRFVCAFFPLAFPFSSHYVFSFKCHFDCRQTPPSRNTRQLLQIVYPVLFNVFLRCFSFLTVIKAKLM